MFPFRFHHHFHGGEKNYPVPGGPRRSQADRMRSALRLCAIMQPTLKTTCPPKPWRRRILPLLGDHNAQSARLILGTRLVAGLGSHWAGVRAGVSNPSSRPCSCISCGSWFISPSVLVSLCSLWLIIRSPFRSQFSPLPPVQFPVPFPFASIGVSLAVPSLSHLSCSLRPLRGHWCPTSVLSVSSWSISSSFPIRVYWRSLAVQSLSHLSCSLRPFAAIGARPEGPPFSLFPSGQFPVPFLFVYFVWFVVHIPVRLGVFVFIRG